MDQLLVVTRQARELGLLLHLDGARLWNAAVALDVLPKEIAAPFDTVSCCFSKGLGAPVGSALCASRELITAARRIRKRLGGGMRQVGILAAGALHALDHHRARLKQDHDNARAIAVRLAAVDGTRVNLNHVQTNIVMVDTPGLSADRVAERARAHGALVAVFGPERIRLVTHLDVADTAIEGAERIAAAIDSLVEGRA
jgi:threonine aldolase